ncbi:MAG: hypothetical protein AAF934_08450 [Bacteroidota bacterium]
MEQLISYILTAVACYSIAGVLFSLLFLWKGLTKTDPATKGSGVVFKLLIFPGLIIFWPLFIRKWIKTNTV